MELETIIGRVYSVTSDAGCTVGFKGADGVVHQQKTVSADTETFFVAKSRLTVVSDDRAVVTVLPSGAAIGLSADGGLQFRVVDALPSEGKSGFVYLAPSASSESGDVFEEWLYVDGSWERFGRKIDLSPFATKSLLQSEIAAHSVPTEQRLAPSVGLDSFAAGTGAVAYCADSLAVGLGAVVGATYESQSKTATATRKSTDAASETNNTSTSYSSNSVAVGLHAQASGFISTAYGNFATANGSYSSAIGGKASADGESCTAIGRNTYAGGFQCTAVGADTSAGWSACTAIGRGANANGTYSLAVGYGAKTKGSFATATGDYSTASGTNSTATGREANANGTYSTATGANSTASVANSTATGAYSTASGANSTATGAYSTASGANSTATGAYSMAVGVSSVALGAGAYVGDAGAVSINAGGAFGNGGTGYSTQLYLITKGSDLSNTYLGGEAGLGYLVLDHVAGGIVARGVIPLASICTEHTSDFEPEGYSNIQDY